jgi:hypothetical protein
MTANTCQSTVINTIELCLHCGERVVNNDRLDDDRKTQVDLRLEAGLSGYDNEG